MSEVGNLSASTTVVASEQQISCDVGDEAVLLSMQNGECYGLKPVAASIWRRVQRCLIDTLFPALSLSGLGDATRL